VSRFRPSADRARRECEQWFLREFYLSANRDASEESRLRELFVEADPSLRSIDAFVLSSGSPPGWQSALIDDFENGGMLTWNAKGDGLKEPLTESERPGQAFVAGQTGAFLTSFGSEREDEAVGSLVSEPLVIEGDVMTFMVGGGPAVKTSIELLDGDTVVASASGCASGMMRRVVWNVERLRGKAVRLRIRDSSTEPLGHISLDTIEIWRRSK